MLQYGYIREIINGHTTTARLQRLLTKNNMMYDYYNYGVFSPFHILFSVIGWVIVFFLVLMVIRAARGGRGRHMHMHGFGGDRAMDVLRERYAKGEITKTEFEERKKDLMS